MHCGLSDLIRDQPTEVKVENLPLGGPAIHISDWELKNSDFSVNLGLATSVQGECILDWRVNNMLGEIPHEGYLIDALQWVSSFQEKLQIPGKRIEFT